MDGARRAVEPGVAVGEDAAVGGDQPVAPAVGGRGHAHDRLIEMDGARRAVEPGVAVGEDAAIGGDQPVAKDLRPRHAHDRPIEAQARCRRGAQLRRSAVWKDAAAARRRPIPTGGIRRHQVPGTVGRRFAGGCGRRARSGHGESGRGDATKDHCRHQGDSRPLVRTQPHLVPPHETPSRRADIWPRCDRGSPRDVDPSLVPRQRIWAGSCLPPPGDNRVATVRCQRRHALRLHCVGAVPRARSCTPRRLRSNAGRRLPHCGSHPEPGRAVTSDHPRPGTRVRCRQ